MTRMNREPIADTPRVYRNENNESVDRLTQQVIDINQLETSDQKNPTFTKYQDQSSFDDQSLIRTLSSYQTDENQLVSRLDIQHIKEKSVYRNSLDRYLDETLLTRNEAMQGLSKLGNTDDVNYQIGRLYLNDDNAMYSKQSLDDVQLNKHESALKPVKYSDLKSQIQTDANKAKAAGKLLSTENQINLKGAITMANTKSEQKHVPFAGKDKELYVESIFVNKNKQGQNLISATMRQRRDVDPEKPYAGAYVTNRSVERKDGSKFNSHSAIINKEALDKLTKANPDSKLSFTDADIEKSAGSGKPLVSGRDNVAFKANVFTDDKNKSVNGGWTHKINPQSIQPSEHKFDYTKEQELNVAARNAKESEAQKDAKETTAQKGKEVEGEELDF